jgi:hypothetical protein
MKIKILLVYLHCMNVLSTDRVIFQKEEGLWKTEEFLNVVLDIDLTPILNECSELKYVIYQMESDVKTEKHQRMLKTTTALYKQACDITQYWNTTAMLRGKRQILEALSAVGAIFGIFNTVEIHHLSTRVDAIEQHLSEAIVVLHKQETRIDAIEKDVEKFHAFAIWAIWHIEGLAIEMNLLSAFQDVLAHIAMLQAHTAAISRAWNALVGGHLSWDLLESSQMVAIQNRIKTAAAKRGGSIPFDSMLDIIQFPASFEARGPKWRIFVHLPIITKEIYLYRHIPVPMYLDQETNATARVVQLQPNKDMLLITTDDMLHQESSRADLQNNCRRFGSRLICDSLGLFYRRLEASCLGSLFGNLPETALKMCPMAQVTKEWDVIQADSHKVVIFSKKGRNIDILFKNGSRTNAIVKGVKELTIEPGCTVSSSEFVLQRSAATELEVRVVQQVSWDREQLAHIWERERRAQVKAQGEADEQVEALGPLVTGPPLTKEEADWLEAGFHPSAPHGRNLLIGLVVCTGTLLVLLLGLLGFLAWRFYRAKATPLESGTGVN